MTDTQLLALSDRVDGTPQERRAWDYLEYASSQTSVATCAEPHGVTYRPPVYLDPSGGLNRPSLPDPVSAAALASVEQARATGLGEEARARYVRAMAGKGSTGVTHGKVPQSCWQNGSDGQEGTPGFNRGLSMRLMDMVLEAADKAGVRQRDEKYAACLRGKMVPVPETDDVQVALQVAAGRLYADKNLRPDTPAWEAAWQQEVRMAVADAECRADDHERYLKALGPELADFEKEHAAEIAQVDRQWGQLPAKAAIAQAAFRKAHPTTAPAINFTG